MRCGICSEEVEEQEVLHHMIRRHYLFSELGTEPGLVILVDPEDFKAILWSLPMTEKKYCLFSVLSENGEILLRFGEKAVWDGRGVDQRVMSAFNQRWHISPLVVVVPHAVTRFGFDLSEVRRRVLEAGDRNGVSLLLVYGREELLP